MSSGIYSAASGAVAQERNLAVIANNVANVSTHGYKADVVAFDEALAAQARAEPQRNISLKYAVLSRVEPDLSGGGLSETGGPLDLALLGDVYFTVRTAAGDRFTRAGAFLSDAAGTVRTPGGDSLLIEGGPRRPEGRELVIPPDTREVLVGEDGVVRADNVELGRLRLRSFARAQDLQKVGLTHFVPSAGVTPSLPNRFQVVQGSLETANLNAVQGLHQMITVNRSFDALQKVIRAFRSIDERTARGLGE